MQWRGRAKLAHTKTKRAHTKTKRAHTKTHTQTKLVTCQSGDDSASTEMPFVVWAGLLPCKKKVKENKSEE